MKKIVNAIHIAIIMLVLNQHQSFAQATTANPTNTPTTTNDYVGWNATTPFDLNVTHNGSAVDASNINFRITGVPRMTIRGVSSAASNSTIGFIGIGNGFNVPQSSIPPDRSLALACVWLPVR